MIYRALFGLGCVLLCSCASVSVKKASYLSRFPAKAVPQKILVKPFAFYDPALNVDRSGEKLTEFKYEFSEQFTQDLLPRLTGYVAPARAIASTAPLPHGNIWLITGRFDRVNQGSWLLRTFVGFGLGASKLETSVMVTDLSGPTLRPFVMIQTTGGTNITPPGFGLLRSGLTFDSIRTAREVTAALSEYLYQQGVFPYRAAIAPKRTGGN